MKELCIEEKAKRYDEKLDVARHIYADPSVKDEDKYYIEVIFPELAESEDEKIRKYLLTLVNQIWADAIEHYGGVSKEQVVAWLEKQGQVKNFAISQHENKTCKENGNSLTSESERTRNRIIKVLSAIPDKFFSNNSELQDMIAWLEKQKLVDKDDLDFAKRLNELRKVQREKNLDELIEMRWSVLKDVEKLTKEIFTMQAKFFFEVGYEKQGEHPTTIPKWKYKKDNAPLLRDSLILNKYGCVAKSPSGALVSDVWVIDYGELAKLPKEKSEKQGEQKPVEWSNADMAMLDCIMTTLSEEDKYEVNKRQIEWLKSIKNKAFPQFKHEWSKEDEQEIEEIIDILTARPFIGTFFLQKHITWLKSLKPQSQWKPSDFPHWKKGNLPNDNSTGFNSDYFCHKGYYINYKELFEKLPKDD